MTVRYVAIHQPSRGYGFSAWGESHPTMMVIEDADAPQKTGLLDANGTPLYRIIERAPVGFAVRRALGDVSRETVSNGVA